MRSSVPACTSWAFLEVSLPSRSLKTWDLWQSFPTFQPWFCSLQARLWFVWHKKLKSANSILSSERGHLVCLDITFVCQSTCAAHLLGDMLCSTVPYVLCCAFQHPTIQISSFVLLTTAYKSSCLLFVFKTWFWAFKRKLCSINRFKRACKIFFYFSTLLGVVGNAFF